MAVLLVGHGHVGTNLIRLLLEQDKKVVVYDVVPPDPKGVLVGMEGQYEMVLGSILDLAHLLRTIKTRHIEGIINLAVMQVDVSMERPIESNRVNIEGALNVLEATRIMGLRRAVLTSTSAFLGRHSVQDAWDSIVFPLPGILAIQRLACENYAYLYKNNFGVDCLVCRPSRVYGPGFWRWSIPVPIEEIIRDAIAGKRIRGSGSDMLFEHSYVKDTARGIMLAYEAEKPKHIAYNIAAGKLDRLSKVVDIVKKCIPEADIELEPGIWKGIGSGPEFKGTKYKIGVRRSAVDIGKAKADFGYEPEYGIDRGIPAYIAWLREGKYL